MTDGTSQGLFIVVAIVIFGIFVVLAYILFEDTLSPAMASMFSNTIEKYNATNEVLVEGDYKYLPIKNSTQVKIVEYIGTNKDVIIPHEINGMDVTVISQNSFTGQGITSVVLPDTLRVIESGSHDSSKPPTGTSFSSGAFYGNNIDKLVIPANLVEIGSDAFANNPLTNGVLFEDGKDIVIKSHAFWNTKITDFTFHERIKEINVGMFEASNNLKTVNLENMKFKHVSSYMFRGTGLDGRFEVPYGYTHIGQRAFSATKIKELYIPKTVTSIGIMFASHNPHLERLELPIHLKEKIDKEPELIEGIDSSILHYYE